MGTVMEDMMPGPGLGSQWDDLRQALQGGVVKRSSELIAAGVCPAVIADAFRRGRIARAAPGAYHLPQSGSHDWEMALAAACARMPKAVACLATAARLHGLLPARTSSPYLWLALRSSEHAGKPGGVAYRILRWSWPGAREVGIQQVMLRGVVLNVTDPARTVVDLFRYARLLDDPGAAVSAARKLASRPGQLAAALDTATRVRLPGPAMDRLQTAAQALDR